MVVKVKVQFGAQKIGGLRYTGDRKRGRNFGDLLCMAPPRKYVAQGLGLATAFK